MNTKKSKPQKAANTVVAKKGKEEPATKTTADSSKRRKTPESEESFANVSSSLNLRNITTRRGAKDKNNKKDTSLTNNEDSQSGKLVDYDELQEVTEFIESLKQNNKKSQPKKAPMEVEKGEDDWEIFRRESKKLTLMAFGLFDKIGLSFEPTKSKIGTTTTQISEIVTTKNLEKEKEKDKDKIEEELPIVQEKENTKMEIEEKKEEIPAPRGRRRMIDLLKVALPTDDDGKNDDRLANINFEPTLEIMRQSTHIDVESVCNLIEQTKRKDTGANEANLSGVALDNLSENHQKINELVSGISETDFQRLEPEVYLNDTLINFYLKLIELGLINNERRNKVHIFNTYFMAKMRKVFADQKNDFSKFDKVYESMGRWTKKIDLFEKDFIMIPVNDNEHWNMVILCNPSKLYSNDAELPLVVYLDSISRMEDTYAKMIYYFFSAEAKAKKKDESSIQSKLLQLHSSGFPYYQPMVPKQSNWTDCGLYLLQYTELFSESENFILNDIEDLNKTRWFPRRLISDKRDDMKRLISDLKALKYDSINEYLDRRNRKMKDYAKYKDQFDQFDQKGFERALINKYELDILTPEEIKILKLDYYYIGSLDYDQQDDMHM